MASKCHRLDERTPTCVNKQKEVFSSISPIAYKLPVYCPAYSAYRMRLNTGATIPVVGLGTWKSAKGEVATAVEAPRTHDKQAHFDKVLHVLTNF